MFSVSDLRNYSFCKRSLWLSKRAKIKSSEKDWDSTVKYRVLRSMSDLVESSKIKSLTDLMFQTLNKTKGMIVGTEIFLKRENLCGKIDVVRKVENGYIIQEEKSSDPPEDDGVWSTDSLQVDAYAFLAEGTEYSPVVGGIVIYNDLKPKKVNPNPERAKEALEKVVGLLKNDTLPEVEGNMNKCNKCGYYSLCQVLPPQGGLTESEIRNAFATPLTGIIQEH